ncbi:Polypeptide-transport-associated domain protein FtsQ-type [Syntrophobotulus glycolicus DSM 8271]|uniref:Polypeptide-transport-associated domain protein FtsQ-type n=1 Tax=Syntrophobotulus glycolicus (strain DSM 8271 / FlGlyR) TaxID=645991 RepID=F0T002_SYNGF|nr:FtsQ-type POTRA domain-containing protein [Syntrophobotulus glycolicus]ADY55013.1 Polypeptide-transport-associated domain protein FtsQ-type [Syntrophobotulus glycolicus DSM 8271]
MFRKRSAALVYLSLLTCLVVVGGFLFLRSAFFTVQKIEIDGLNRIANEEISKLIGNVKGENIFTIDTADLATKIQLHPFVEQAAVERKLPSTLKVAIKERKAAALIVAGEKVVEVDLSGIVLKYYEGWPKEDSPVLTGVSIPESTGPGQKVSSPEIDALMKLVGQVPPELLPKISEISYKPSKQINLYLLNGIEVRLGYSGDYAEKIKLLNELLNSADFQAVEKSIKYIDLTAGKPVLG